MSGLVLKADLHCICLVLIPMPHCSASITVAIFQKYRKTILDNCNCRVMQMVFSIIYINSRAVFPVQLYITFTAFNEIIYFVKEK